MVVMAFGPEAAKIGLSEGPADMLRIDPGVSNACPPNSGEMAPPVLQVLGALFFTNPCCGRFGP